MIRSVAVVDRAIAEAPPRAFFQVALITIVKPGCVIAVPADLPALRLSFDTLAGELEAASLRLAQATAAVPFDITHAQSIQAFLTTLQLHRQWIDLLVCETDSYSRGVTVARWIVQRLGCPSHEPESAVAVASCPMMNAVLNALSPLAHPVRQRVVPITEPVLQP